MKEYTIINVPIHNWKIKSDFREGEALGKMTEFEKRRINQCYVLEYI